MTTLQQGRVEIEPLEQRLPTEPRRVGAPMFWIVVAIALLAVAGAVIGLVVLTAGEEPAPEPVPASPEAAVPQAVVSTDPDVRSCQLAAQGLIPMAACDVEAYHTVKLQAQQLIPTEADDPPRYSREELETLRLVREGLLPRQVLQSTVWTTKRLVNEGLIPEAAVR